MKTDTLFPGPLTREEALQAARDDYRRLPPEMAVQATPVGFFNAALKRGGFKALTRSEAAYVAAWSGSRWR